ncbi:DNA polymerase Y family protein [Pseudonocardiaceae bacterium YIM PH 21723]|nr:DNA polymerase Y family protein [Pseudonocardiaceae bacterium YIM PH 21723]
MLAVWVPDWPVLAACKAAGADPLRPAAVFRANRVIASSAAARSEGIYRGMRRRESQAKCPELLVFDEDADRDARLFEPIVTAVEELAPGVELVRPGLITVPARGPAGYFGSEESAAERIIDQVPIECQIGVADGLFAATLAAQRAQLVPPGQAAGFLNPLPITELDQPADRSPQRAELVGLLRRLGLRTLGAFAGLPETDVASRIGLGAVLAHRLCRGLDPRPPDRRKPPANLEATQDFDPPIDRVDAAAFAGRGLADQLHGTLLANGLACTRLTIEARTEHGEERSRTWRCAEPLTPADTADRVRWQLEGWLTGGARPTAGVFRMRLIPEEVIGATALQFGLWNADGDGPGPADDRAGRALARVQGLLGPDSVFTGVLGGGRSARDRVRLVPWGEPREPAADPGRPWPGRLPEPSPTLLPDRPDAVTVLSAAGEPVAVTGRHLLTAAPHRVALPGRRPQLVQGWAGPWPVSERWWLDLIPDRSRRSQHLTRLQLILEQSAEDQLALLLAFDGHRWWLEGAY